MMFKKKPKCFMCEKKIDKDEKYATIKYRYEDEKIGEVKVCDECVEKYELNSETN